MTYLTRRDTIKSLSAAAAAVSVPVSGLAFLDAGSTLLEHVSRRVVSISQDDINESLRGAYSEVFRIAKSTMATELVVHYRMSDLGYTRAVVRERDKEVGQRFVYCASTSERSFGFAVVADDDVRAAPHQTTDSHAGIYSLFKCKAETIQPWRVSELAAAIARLIWVMKEVRDQEAADVLNNANCYDATLGGDGVPLISINHPYDDGVWANTFGVGLTGPIPCDLNPTSHADAEARLLQFVNDQGYKLPIRPEKLIVSRVYADMAAEIGKPYIVWDKLTPYSWFITTSVDGLRWYERDPFEITVFHDAVTSMVIVKAYERRCFTYTDPRAVFGCVPHRSSQGI